MLIDRAIRSPARQLYQKLARFLIGTFSSFEGFNKRVDPDRAVYDLKHDKRIFEARPWREDFSELGIRTRYDDYPKPFVVRAIESLRTLMGMEPYEGPGGFINQAGREAVIFPMFQEIFGEKLKDQNNLRFLETFCNAGFYAYYASTHYKNIGQIIGAELDPVPLSQGHLINECFQLADNVELKHQNVYDLPEDEHYDVTMCMGGLYHVDRPKELIDHLSKITDRYLIAHSVIVWDEDLGDDYIVVPAPGLSHGSRFSYKFFRKCLTDNGWNIIREGTTPAPATYNNFWNSKFGWFLCEKPNTDAAS